MTTAPSTLASAPPAPQAPTGGRPARGRGGIVAHVVLVTLLVVALYPIVYMIGTSFKSPAEIANNLDVLPEQFTPGNYAEGWAGIPGATFARFFVNSLALSAGVVVGNLVSCALAAYAFARLRFPLRGVWFALMIGTLLLPHHVLVVPQYVLFNNLGWINTTLPIIVPKLLATDAFFVFLMVQFMRGIPRTRFPTTSPSCRSPSPRGTTPRAGPASPASASPGSSPTASSSPPVWSSATSSPARWPPTPSPGCASPCGGCGSH